MSREQAIARAAASFDDGSFQAVLARRVAIATESQAPESFDNLRRYLVDEIAPAFAAMGYANRLFENPERGGGPILVAKRVEDPALPTVLGYGHGDVVLGHAGRWSEGRDPWVLTVNAERWYGRGTADNKAQHTIHMTALAAVLATRGRLGFNSTFMVETSEEIGSPGLHAFCAKEKEFLAADLLLASDGPRLSMDTPTVFLGARGAMNFDLTCDLRAGGHHSGNWGGLLANPAIILANAIACLIGADGRIKVRQIVPETVLPMREALAGLSIDPGHGGPPIDDWWGEPGLTGAERVFAWNTLEILACSAGDPEHPVNAIPPKASAHCQIRFTVDVPPESFLPAIRAHLDREGFANVVVTPSAAGVSPATRLDPEHPAAAWAGRSIERTLGRTAALLPNVGGWLPNDCFADILGMPTVWIPHSYAGCSQHAPDEHVLAPLMREGLQMMAGLYWDFAEAPPMAARRTRPSN